MGRSRSPKRSRRERSESPRYVINSLKRNSSQCLRFLDYPEQSSRHVAGYIIFLKRNGIINYGIENNLHITELAHTALAVWHMDARHAQISSSHSVGRTIVNAVETLIYNKY